MLNAAEAGMRARRAQFEQKAGEARTDD